MAVKIFYYPKCSTCRKALGWLDARGVEYTRQDLVASVPTRAQLEALRRRSGKPLAKLFNTSGESYRAGRFKDKLATMTEAQALDALAKDGKLIKRPIIDTGDAVIIGFDEAALTQVLQ